MNRSKQHTFLSTAFLSIVLPLSAVTAQNQYPDDFAPRMPYVKGTVLTQRVPFGKEIASIQVRHGSRIDNIRFSYRNRGEIGGIAYGPWLGTGTGGSAKQWTLKRGDSIIKFRYYYDNGELTGAQFSTRLGHTSPRFGSTGNGDGSKSILTSYEAIGFHGIQKGSILIGLGLVARQRHTDFHDVPAASVAVLQGLKSWEQSPDSNNALNRRIRKVEARVSGGRITGLRTGLRNYEGGAHAMSSWSGSGTGGSTSYLGLDRGDYLERIELSYDSYSVTFLGRTVVAQRVKALRLVSHTGKQKQWGTPAGAWTQLETPFHGEIYGLFGRAEMNGAFIESIGVNYRTFSGLTNRVASGCVGEQRIHITSRPQIRLDGQPVPFGIRFGPIGGFLLLDIKRTTTQFGACTLMVDPLTPLTVSVPATGAIINLPSTANLIGAPLFAQGIMLQPSGPIFGALTLTDLLEMRIGAQY